MEVEGGHEGVVQEEINQAGDPEIVEAEVVEEPPVEDEPKPSPKPMAPKKKPPPVKDPEGCYFFPGCLEKVHPTVPKFKYTKQPEFSKPSQLCLYHLDWQPSQFYNICTFCAIFHRDDEVKLVKMPVEGKELKKMKDKKNKKKGAGGGKKGKKGTKSAAPKKGKGKGGKGGDEEDKKDKPKEEPIKNEITIAICKQCLPIGCEVVTPVLEPPKEEPLGLL